MRIAIYPGSFDPITNGHIDILKRALKVFDKVIVLVAINPKKKPFFSTEERVEMIKQVIKDEGIKNAEVDSYLGLTVEYARTHNAPYIVRGLRAVSDYEYEFQIASANEFIDSDVESIFFMSHNDTSFISSSMILELHANKVDVSHLVPKEVMNRLNKKGN